MVPPDDRSFHLVFCGCGSAQCAFECILVVIRLFRVDKWKPQDDLALCTLDPEDVFWIRGIMCAHDNPLPRDKRQLV